MALNNVVLMGRLTAIPELKKTQNSTSFTNFQIAVDRKYQPQGEERKADFIPCEAWRGAAEFITKYFGKGDMIAVTGEIQTNPYTDKNGNKRTGFKIVIDNVSFCGGKNNNVTNEAAASNNESFENYGIADDEDLPF